MTLQRRAAIAAGLPKERVLWGKPWDLAAAYSSEATANRESAKLRRKGDYRTHVLRVGSYWCLFVRLSY